MKKKKIVICIVAVILVTGAAAGMYLEMKSHTGNVVSEHVGSEPEAEMEPTHELTEEEIAILESQEGVTVSEDGTMEIDVSSNMPE